jgi:hypothetical protein
MISRFASILIVVATVVGTFAPVHAVNPGDESVRRLPVRASDFDGDGLPDVGMVRSQNPPPTDVPVVESTVSVLRGTDGAPIWTKTLTGSSVLQASFSARGPDGSPFAVVGLAGQLDDRVEAYGRDGRTMWTRPVPRFGARADTWPSQIIGVYAGIDTMTSGGTVAVIPDADGDAGDDVAFTTWTRTGADVGLGWRTVMLLMVDVVSGSSGEPIASARFPERGEGARVVGAEDLDGDGLGDLIVSTGSSVTAIKGSTGSVLWSDPMRSWTSALVSVIEDLDADGTQDVMVGAVKILSGVTGDELLKPGGQMQVVGDVDDDGDRDVGVITAVGSGAIVYRTYDVRSRALVDEAWFPVGGGSRTQWWPAGDLDGDGIQDWMHEAFTDPWSSEILDARAVSGRTLATLWAGGIHPVLKANVDGVSGDDMFAGPAFGREPIFELIGFGGVHRWSRSFVAPHDGGRAHPVFTADMDGRGAPELVVVIDGGKKAQFPHLLTSYERSQEVVVLDGASGETRWTYAD